MLNNGENIPYPYPTEPANRPSPLEEPLVRSIVLIVVILALFGAVTWLRGTFGSTSAPEPQRTGTSVEFDSAAAPNTFLIKKVDDRLFYEIDGEVLSQTGIDVSEHQQNIDWKKVKDDGIDFAMIRIGRRQAIEGDIVEDPFFDTYYQGCVDNHIDAGAYFFSQAVTEEEAIEEAQFVIAKLAGRTLPYPIAYDHEPVADVDGRADEISVEQMTANAKAFCDTIDENGYAAMIYGSTTDLARYNLDELAGYGIWFAEYGTTQPSRLGRYTMWQYTNVGSVDGIEGDVDINLRFPKIESATL